MKTAKTERIKASAWYPNNVNFRTTGWHLCRHAEEIGWEKATERVPDLKGGFLNAPTISQEEMDRVIVESEFVAELADVCYKRGINPLPLLRKLTPTLKWEYVRGQQYDPNSQSGPEENIVVASFAIAEVGNCVWDWIAATPRQSA